MSLISTLLLACLPAAQGVPPAPPGAGWTNVTAGVGGETWGYAGVTLMAAVPDRDEIIAGVSEAGLWSSLDGGATWKKLGGAEIRHRPHQILFDPKDPRIFWVSGNYGPGLFRTTDGGVTFKRLGKLEHVDGVAVDFTDPARKTLLAGLHEQSCSLQLSRDGGETWEKIGDRLPPDSNHSTDPLVFDAKTFVINTAGWKKGASSGIYRSVDAGTTWSKVFDGGPGGRALTTSDGTVYWKGVWGGNVIRSADQGATWSKVPGPVKSSLIELPGGMLAGLSDGQLHLSKDGGATWTKRGEPAPLKAQGVVYSAKRGAFYVWKMTDKKSAESVYRLDGKDGT